MAEPILCEVIQEGDILDIGSFRFIVAPRVGEIISVSLPDQNHDDLFRVLRVMHSALESRESGDHIKLVVTRDLGI